MEDSEKRQPEESENLNGTQTTEPDKYKVPHEIISECDTESFEDLGPSASLGIRNGNAETPIDMEKGETGETVTNNEKTEQIAAPPITNISAVQVSSPYTSSGAMVQRRVTDEVQSAILWVQTVVIFINLSTPYIIYAIF